MATVKSSSAPSKRAIPDYSKTITVLVGGAERAFVLPEAIITNRSKFFRAACSGNFKESEDRIVRLPEIKTKYFKVYLHHVYSGEIVVTNDHQGVDEAGIKRYEALAKLYKTGCYLVDLSFQNAILDNMIQLSDAAEKFLPAAVAEELYSPFGTPVGILQ